MVRGISMHIGLNAVNPGHYGGWSGPLRACEYDAQDLEAIAASQEFSTHMMLTAKATRDAVESGIREAAASLSEGDIFLLTYSGHGGQVPDWNADEKDAQDETWCLFDGEFIDDELWNLWKDFRAGVRILVLSDSCHSGTVVKEYYRALRSAGMGGAVEDVASPREDRVAAPFRVMPDEVAVRTYRQNRDFYKDVQKGVDREAKAKVKASVLLISGCQDNQYSLDGTFNGLFTGTLLKTWRDGTFKGTYPEFHSAILAQMPPTQSPNYFTVGTPNRAFEGEGPFTI